MVVVVAVVSLAEEEAESDWFKSVECSGTNVPVGISAPKVQVLKLRGYHIISEC